jgi:hypothetical protein
MELAVARRLVNAYTKWRNTRIAQERLAEDPSYNAAENRYVSLLVQAGNRPWPKHIQNRVNNANKRRLQIYSESVNRMGIAREQLNQAKAAARNVFGPGWTNMNPLNVRPFVRLIETANARARRIVRKSMGSTMAAKANARRRPRNMISHELSFYTMGKNNNNNTTIKPSNVKRRRLSNK